jgi:hypothetical protein
MTKPERTARHRLSRHQVIWLAVASQIAFIGGLFAWGYYLASDATGSPSADVTAAITTWVSAPGWQVAPILTTNGNSSQISLHNSEPGNALSPPLDVQVVVVLWGDAQFTDLHPDCVSLITIQDCNRPLSSAQYQQLQVPRAQALNYLGREDILGPTVPAQIFRVPLRGDDFGSVFPLVGRVSPSIYTMTSTGWTVFVPTIGPPGASSGSCSSDPAPLPAAIATAIGSNQQGWYGTGCPTPEVFLQLGADERFSDSTQPPTINGDFPAWTDQPQPPIKFVVPVVGGFWIDVADPDIAAATQRDLLFAGVLYGIAGGVLATWLTAAATVTVKRWSPPRAKPAGPRTDEAGTDGTDGPKQT